MKPLITHFIRLTGCLWLLFACQPEEIKINEFSDVFVTFSPLTINVNGEVSFADGSRGVKSRLWTFPEGVVDLQDADNNTTSEERIVHATFLQPGVFGVRLQTIFNDPTVTLDSIITVTVLDNVIAKFTSDARIQDGVLVVETGGTVSFTSESTGLPDSYMWTFEGGMPESATGKNVSVQYNYPGVWDVTLIAYRNKPRGRDTIAVKNYITVLPPQNN